MLRQQITDRLKQSMQARDEASTGAIRLMMATLKERDIAARSKGNKDGISDEEILSMLQTMIKQRNESIKMYEAGNRPELAAREMAEIKVIETFLPKQLSEDEIKAAIDGAIQATAAAGIKDMGKVMGELKAKYTGQIDFAKAGPLVKEKLSA